MSFRVGLIAVLALASSCSSSDVGGAGAPSLPSVAGVASAPGSPSSAAAAPTVVLPDFATLAERLVPAVVKIETEQRAEVSQPEPPGVGSPFDLFHFGPRLPRENRGLGSGFFIEGRGLILTNAHVVENADVIRVTIGAAGEERTLEAELVGHAPDFDIALIRTKEDAGAPVVTLGDSDAVRIGEWVMAVGNPLGLDHSVSVGIISAKERRDVAPSGRDGLYDFLQTDASINPGNSGGPLVNTRGEVIGINSAVNAAGQGIGFAIPINIVKAMLPRLEKGGRYARSWIGVRIQSLTGELAQSYGLPDSRGVLVAEVVDQSPAAAAGILEGDVILEFGGQRVGRSSDLPLFASMAGVGKAVPLTVWRDGKARKLSVTLQEYPEDQTRLARVGAPRGGRALGLELGELTPEMRSQLGVESERGAVVESLEPDSPGERAGLQPGDVLLSIDGEPVGSAIQAAQLLAAKQSGAVIRLKVERRGTRLFAALRKP